MFTVGAGQGSGKPGCPDAVLESEFEIKNFGEWS
jgi:hypothetical protein